MSEIHSPIDASHIDDYFERTFALAVLTAFPHITLFHEASITAHSGKRIRTTRPDFLLTNSQDQQLYVEIAGGNTKTRRKSKQHKTARLAGFGSIHVTLYGSEVESLQGLELDDVRREILRLLYLRFTPALFDFEQ